MPLEINLPDESDAVSLEEFIDTIDSAKYDFSNQADLIDSAALLRKLGNNRTFLVNRLLDELKTIANFQRTNFYGPQVFMLHVAETYFIRANVWCPLSKVERSVKGFQYDICHDHNFDILTLGYFGPGYLSRCYTYDRSLVIGCLGEQVPLFFEGVFNLYEGRVALYRAKRDVHIQMPPSDISVSLNLIPRNDKIRDLQFQFDEGSSRICRYLQASGSEVILRLAGLLGDPECLEPLAAISKTNQSPQLRALAAISQLQISTEAVIPADFPLLVRYLIDKESRDYGSCLKVHALDRNLGEAIPVRNLVD